MSISEVKVTRQEFEDFISNCKIPLCKHYVGFCTPNLAFYYDDRPQFRGRMKKVAVIVLEDPYDTDPQKEYYICEEYLKQNSEVCENA